MSNSGGFAVSRAHPDGRFYHPPPVRRHQQQLLRQQQQQRAVRSEAAQVESPESEPPRTELEESALSVSRPNSVCSSSTEPSADLTHLDRLIKSVSPSVRTHHLPEVKKSGGRAQEPHSLQYFSLGDLWEAFREWSVYGVGVPLVLNGSESVKQYYVPSLSGIQLYVDTHGMRKPGEDSDVESSRETSSCGSSDCEAERKGKGNINGIWSQESFVKLNSEKMNRLTLRDKNPAMSSSGNEAEVGNSSGQLVFEYLEQEQPHHRKPLYDKVTNLAIQFPDLKRYPIYRIPVGPTLQNLDASFLTFHHLSTPSRSKVEPQLRIPGGRKVHGLDLSSRLSLEVFGLASYKLRGSILSPNSAHELQQASFLLQAADKWLSGLQVNLPDYQFFVSHNSHWR